MENTELQLHDETVYGIYGKPHLLPYVK